jgi:hypothetical protein
MLQGAWRTLWGDSMIPNDMFELAVSDPCLGTHEWHLTHYSLVPSTRTRQRAMAQLYVPAGARCLRATTRKAWKPFGSARITMTMTDKCQEGYVEGSGAKFYPAAIFDGGIYPPLQAHSRNPFLDKGGARAAHVRVPMSWFFSFRLKDGISTIPPP